MKRVLDASVILKWFLENRADEEDVEAAMDILRRVRNDEVETVQPVHWCAEVLAVLAREEPLFVESAAGLLDEVAFVVADGWHIYRRAAEMSVTLNHHLFDTLYHAVALEHGAELITADKKYFDKARKLGSITLLG
jgi:predicted nucleic acid-binding protein